jgi:hypothetical protein
MCDGLPGCICPACTLQSAGYSVHTPPFEKLGPIMPDLSPDTKGIVYRVLLNALVKDRAKMDAFGEIAGMDARKIVDLEITAFLNWLKLSAGY